MTRLILVLCVGLLCAACDGRAQRHPLTPSSARILDTLPSPPSPSPQAISLGELRGTFFGSDLAYELIAPTSGVLEAHLSWDVNWNGSLLVLVLDGRSYSGRAPNWSPVVGNTPVIAGRPYRLVISGGGTDWWYDDKFVLTTSIK